MLNNPGMTNLDSRKTYGLLSKTILHVLANEGNNDEQTFAFSLYMHWGIIMGHPDPDKIKLAAEILLRQTEKLPDDMKINFIDDRKTFLKIYKQASAPSIPAKFSWYTTWKKHCKELLKQGPSIENCLLLFAILNDCMELKHHEQLLSTTIIHETLLYVGAAWQSTG
jgi:hypothetical protein